MTFDESLLGGILTGLIAICLLWVAFNVVIALVGG